MLPVAEAQAKLLALVRPLPAERVSIEEAAGRVLAEDIDAATAVPPFSSSTMDGYALNAPQVAALPLPFYAPHRRCQSRRRHARRARARLRGTHLHRRAPT